MEYKIGNQVRCSSIDARTDEPISWLGTIHGRCRTDVNYPPCFFVQKRNGNIVHVLEAQIEPYEEATE